MVQRKQSQPVINQRKPIRPIERQKMRPWLVNLLNNEKVPGFSWVSRDHETFRISWRHAARQGWDPLLDAGLFERWAKHTGTLHSLNLVNKNIQTSIEYPVCNLIYREATICLVKEHAHCGHTALLNV